MNRQLAAQPLIGRFENAVFVSLTVRFFLLTVSDSQMEQGYRSEVQERALVVSLQMFNLILERGVSLLKSQLDSGEEPRMVVSEDMQVLLPAIKVFPLSMAYLIRWCTGGRGGISIEISFSEKLSPYRETASLQLY